MSSKDPSVVSKMALTKTKFGKQILKQGLFKSKGFVMFQKYKKEIDQEFPSFARRFTEDLLREIKADQDPISSQQSFAEEIVIDDPSEIILERSQISSIKSKLENIDILGDRVSRILNSNFVKMTFPVFNALYDSAANTRSIDTKSNFKLRRDLVEGHIIAIDLSEPMDRIIDKDEDVDYLDDYKLMNPYILKIARNKILTGGQDVLDEFEKGFKNAQEGQYMDSKLKSKSNLITEEDMSQCYKKYRAVMGTAGLNMALAKRPLGEIFYLGMARTAEGVGCGNEIEDSIKNRFIKIPSWPLYYSLLSSDVKKGFKLTLQKSDLYLQDARLALDLLPDNFSHREFLEFLFLTVEHYNHFWYNQLEKTNMWSEFESKLPNGDRHDMV